MQTCEQAGITLLLHCSGRLFGKTYSRMDQVLNLLMLFSVFLSELDPMEYSSWNMVKIRGSFQEIKYFLVAFLGL